MLIPSIYKVKIQVPNEEGVLEDHEIERLAFYQANSNPYIHCKSCQAKHKADDKVIMHHRRSGSAYCQKCSDEAKESNAADEYKV